MVEEFDVEPQTRKRTQASAPQKILCRKRTPTLREYVLKGRRIPRRPDTSSIEGKDVGVEFTTNGTLVVKVSNAKQWPSINQAIADAIAVAAGGGKAKPV